MTAAIAAVLAAWTEPGPRPDIHEVAKARLRAEWPALASALDQLERSAHVAGLASTVSLDWEKQELRIDGVGLPWLLDPQGPRVERTHRSPFATVWVPVLCEELLVIGEPGPPANVSRETFAHVDPLKLQLGQIVEAYAWPVAPGDAPVARGTFVAVVDGETMLDSPVAILDDPAADNPHAQTRVRIDRHEFRIVKAGA